MAMIEHLPFGPAAAVAGGKLYQGSKTYSLEINGNGQMPLLFGSGGIEYLRSRVGSGSTSGSDRSEIAVCSLDNGCPNDQKRYVGFGLYIPWSGQWLLPGKWGTVFQVLQAGDFINGISHPAYSPALSLNFTTINGIRHLSLVGRGDGGYKRLFDHSLQGGGDDWWHNRLFKVIIGFNLAAGQAYIRFHRPWGGGDVSSGWIDHDLLLTAPYTADWNWSFLKFGLYSSAMAFGGSYFVNYSDFRYAEYYGNVKTW